MNKICTSLEQSQKLVELGIDASTADMYYGIDDDTLKYDDLPWLIPYHKYTNKEFYIPCWSLSALLDVLPLPTLSKDELGNDKEGWMVSAYPYDCRYDSCWHDNPVDACVEMIVKLNELKLL